MGDESCMQTLTSMRDSPMFRHGRMPASYICGKSYSTGGADACSSDYGGPLQCYPTSDPDSTQLVQVGVSSWSMGCDQLDIPTIYADVSGAQVWITRNAEGPVQFV